MVATGDKVFAGSIPEMYERLMVPLIFEPYALDLAGRIAKTKPGAVLETAAGTGVLTRGDRRTRWRCRLRMEALMPWPASSVRCFFPTRCRATKKRAAS